MFKDNEHFSCVRGIFVIMFSLQNGESGIDESYEALMSRIGSMQAMDKMFKQTQSKLAQESPKTRVGINPNLGNAGVVWESGKKVILYRSALFDYEENIENPN